MTQTTAFHSAVLLPNNAAETYSNDLMDDLFSDVDQILGGDLSEYMTVVGHQPKPIQSNGAMPASAGRAVQLPSHSAYPNASCSSASSGGRSAATSYRSHVGPSVGDRSYALNVRAATTRSVAQQPTNRLTNPSASRDRSLTHNSDLRSSGLRNSGLRNSDLRNSGFGGGRPVTAPRKTVAQSGNFHAAVIQAPNQTAQQTDQTIYGASEYGTSEDPIQSVSNYLYPNHSSQQRDFTFASPRPTQTIFEPKGQKQVSLPFLLMGAAGISAASTVGLWALSQSAPDAGWLLSLNREASAAELPEHSKEDFLAYLQQSLDVISARQASEGQTLAAVIPVANRTSTLPTTVPNTNPAPQSSVLPNLPGAAATSAAPNVIERVFVPVYQNAQAQLQAKAAPPLPSVAVPNTQAQLPKVPVPAPVAAAAAIPPGAPATAAPSVPIVPTGVAQLPTPPPPVPVAISPANAAAVTDTTPTSAHVLVGVLNLGSRSAALFNIDGTSQRAYVGDRIGVSDWTLVSVNGQDVQVRRNGEVRSIYIGQRF